MDVHGVIMAGGKGARLRPLTYKLPKPLIEVNGKTLIAGVLDRMVDAGVPKITIVVNYKGDMIQEAIGNEWKGVSIDYFHETTPLGTAGALPLIKTKHDTFFVSNADIITDQYIGDMIAYHIGVKADITVAIRKINHAIPYGVISTVDDKVYSILEKPVTSYEVNAGMYVIDAITLIRIPDNQYFDMTTLINDLCMKRGNVRSFPINGVWRDIGRHEDLREVENAFLQTET